MKKIILFLLVICFNWIFSQNVWMEYTSQNPKLNKQVENALNLAEFDKNYMASFSQLKEIEKNDNTADHPVENAQLKNAYGTVLRMSGNYPLAAKFYNKALELLNNEHPNEQAYIYYAIYRNYVEQSDFKNGLNALYKMLKIYESQNNLNGIARAKTEIGGLYSYRENYKLAAKYLEESKKIALQIDDRKLLYLNNLYYTNFLIYQKKLDDALKSSFVYMPEIRGEKNSKILGYTFENISTIYYQKKDFKKAVSYIDSALANTNRDFEKAFYLTNKSIILAESGNSDEAEKILLDFLKNKKFTPRLDYQIQARQGLADIYKKQGKKDKAAEQIIISNEISKKLEARAKDSQISEAEYNYLLNQKEQDFRHKSFWVKTSLYAATGLLALLAFMFYRYQKKNKIKQAQEKQLVKNLQYEKESAEKKQVALYTEKSNIERTLAAKTIFLAENSKVLKDISVEFSEMKKSEELSIEKINELDKKLKNSFRIEKDWDRMVVHFEKVNPDFFSKLKKINPKLTPNELKHCAYIKIKLNNKETAQLLGIEPHSVKTMRYRLKKKFNLGIDDDFTTFMDNI